MLRIIITFIVSILFANGIDNISYDYSKHQGHIRIEGDILWNEDWFSRGIFFDGTFSNYPSMYGPQIEKHYVQDQSDSFSIDSAHVDSYFNYVQGDYFLDNLDIGIKYYQKNRFINLHAFKKRFTGIYNQYSNSSGLISPIQYSYTGSYFAKRQNDQVTVSLGNFNSDYGLFDSTSLSFLDSRITSSSIKYELKHDSIEVVINMHNFLQRLDSFHSSSYIDGVKYLTRTKIEGGISFITSNKYDFGFLFEINDRSFRHEYFKRQNWKTLGIFIKNKVSKYSLAFTPYEDKGEIISSVESKFRIGPIYSTINVKHNTMPAHIAIVDTLLFEVKNKLNLKNELQLNKSRFGCNLAIYKNSRSFYYEDLPSGGTSWWMSCYLNYSVSKNLLFDISYDRLNADKYVYDGIRDRLKIKISGDLNLFSKSMALKYFISLDGYLGRQYGYALSPVEKFPIKATGEEQLKNIWVPSLSVMSTVKNMEIKYEMINILSIVYDFLGKKHSDNPIVFNQFFPSESRLATLSIMWKFSN